MIEELKRRVCEQNIALKRSGLAVLTWGNVSGIDRGRGLIAIKPSGVDYDDLTPDGVALTDLEGNAVGSGPRPSSDTPTHVYLYKAFPSAGAIVHTHSAYATAFAQAGMAIPVLGTTHADAFHGDVPCARQLTEAEAAGDYELNTGKAIAETVADCVAIPAALVRGHGAFVWGETPEEAVVNAITLEEVAKLAFLTLTLDRDAERLPGFILDKHYFRKHGKNAYYGQKRGK